MKRASGRMRVGPLLVATASVVLFPPVCSPLVAQTLEAVETFARQGRAADARETLSGWWELEYDGASRGDLQRALWLRATLTLDPQVAIRDYRRLAVEYPGGTYSDRALLRVAQEAQQRDAWDQASRAMETLARDYPASALRGDARVWLERNREQVERARTALANPALEEAPPPAGDGPFTVQLGAFAELARARAIEETAQRASLEPRLVRLPGSDLVRVRIGRFESVEQAEELMRRTVDLGLDAIVVQDAEREIRLR